MSTPISGWYSINRQGMFSSISCRNGQMVVTAGDKSISLDESCEGHIRILGLRRRQLSIMCNGIEALGFVYQKSVRFPDADVHAHIADEDYDWGLFVCNLINNSEARIHACDQWSNVHL